MLSNLKNACFLKMSYCGLNSTEGLAEGGASGSMSASSPVLVEGLAAEGEAMVVPALDGFFPFGVVFSGVKNI